MFLMMRIPLLRLILKEFQYYRYHLPQLVPVFSRNPLELLQKHILSPLSLERHL